MVRAVTELMNARYAEELRLEELSAAVALTPFQLIGLFKRATGLPPHAHLPQVRLGAASPPLRRGVPIAEVAPASGFSAPSALPHPSTRSYGKIGRASGGETVGPPVSTPGA